MLLQVRLEQAEETTYEHDHHKRGWENRKGSDHIADGERLVPATEEAIAEVARDAMLLAQGHERAAQMLGEQLSDEGEPTSQAA